MARTPSANRPERPHHTVAEKRRDVLLLNRRIAELQQFDVSRVAKRFSDPEVEAMEASIGATLAGVFGYGSAEYNRYASAQRLDHGTISMDSDWIDARSGRRRDEVSEAQNNLREGIARAVALLGQAVKMIEEEIEFSSEEGSTQGLQNRNVARSENRPSYTQFERNFLASCYLRIENTHEEIVGARDVIGNFSLRPQPNWIRRAIQNYLDQGYARGHMTLGEELEQSVYLTAEGIKEAERLIDEGIVSLDDLENNRASAASPNQVVLIDAVDAEVVPASDRIVSLNHNSVEYQDAIQQTDALAEALATSNDVGSMTQEQVAIAAIEVSGLQRDLQGNAVRADAFWTRAKSVLGWIAQEAASAVLGSLAVGALVAIAALLGLPSPF